MASKAKKHVNEPKQQSKAGPVGSVAVSLAALYIEYRRFKNVMDRNPVNSDRYCEAVDQMQPIEEKIMTFPSTVPTSTLGDLILMARVAWDQMNADPNLPTPWDDFVLYLVPAILRLDAETDVNALDLWLYSLKTGERSADEHRPAPPVKQVKPRTYDRLDSETELIEVESLLKAAHLSAGAARNASDLDEARGFGAAAEAVIEAAMVRAEKLRTAMYAKEA